ncbi:hypothetical protein GUITHDRAFT_122867 [Guillardia theta CCMP2712]|uniref:Uncharacterized protein n=1 Tax=Guillardia theta (strain CCMP2712) TaxID=905079 RepID=L1I4D0_GUITC|nr:hypothetical protein GUITHDRAFT_122867 [Guillardia theta CCMP2712]EKX30927.1 hypothetical protein GUITHDRAFT_122867 [Guillardia theta CCMP2712]|eukprot:XP_005817907.1 hypothetical protein GUITHDRAFT_122867 [Guillardia theta CCMP2712]
MAVQCDIELQSDSSSSRKSSLCRVPGLEDFDLVVKAQSALPKFVSHVYEGRLVGLDVKPRVGMMVVHTRLARGAGVIVKVMKIPNDVLNAPRGGVCRVSWDNERFNTREGCYTGRGGVFSLAAVKLDGPGGAELEKLRENKFEMGEVLVGKHLKPRIVEGVGVEDGEEQAAEVGKRCDEEMNSNDLTHGSCNCCCLVDLTRYETEQQWDKIGASSKELNTGQRGQYQLALILSSPDEDKSPSGSSEDSDNEEKEAALPPLKLLRESSTLVGMVRVKFTMLEDDEFAKDVSPVIGMRVRQEWHPDLLTEPRPSTDDDALNDIGTIVQLGANGKLASVRWDRFRQGLNFYPVGFNEFYELELDSTPKPRTLILGRDCFPQVGHRVEMLDPSQETGRAALDAP